MKELPNISNALEKVVQDTEAALIADTSVNFVKLPKKLYYMQGNLKEVMAVLQAMSSSPDHKDKKYPLIAFIRDVKETIIEHNTGLSVAFKGRLGIFTLTDQAYRAGDRETNSFNPILRPILAHLLDQFSKSRAFGRPSIKSMAIVKWDCFFFGTQKFDKNPLNDFIDAIDIESISLNLKNNC